MSFITGEVNPLPKGPLAWEEVVRRISEPGRVAEIDRKTYKFYLDVLPPRWMEKGAFCFAEGAEPYRLFWRKEDCYFARQLGWDETRLFVRLAHWQAVSLPRGGAEGQPDFLVEDKDHTTRFLPQTDRAAEFALCQVDPGRWAGRGVLLGREDGLEFARQLRSESFTLEGRALGQEVKGPERERQ